MCRPKGCGFTPFWSENGNRLYLLRSEFGSSFWGNTEVNKRINLSFQVQMNKKEKVMCEFQMDFKKYFCLRSNLSNDNIISAYARSDNGNGFLEARSKTRCGKWQLFWSEKGQDLENRAAHPYREFPGIPPPPPPSGQRYIQYWREFQMGWKWEPMKIATCYRPGTKICFHLYSRTSLIRTLKGQSKLSVLERCPCKRGHYDDVTFMTPLTVLSVQ